ncbi:MAG: glycine oxidase ThiO [Acidobacteria bacterium]|nr:glycine oxidase ThiO [Acidobacteriota bacterium]
MNVLIIGGGIIALTAARELKKRGAERVTIVEKGVLGREASFAAAGMLAPNAESNGTGEFHQLCSASNRLFPALAGELLAETGVNIELDLTGTLFVGFTDEDEAEIEERYAIQKKAGVNVVPLSGKDVLALEKNVSGDVRKGLLYPDDGQVENRKLVAALRRYAELNDVVIRENTFIDRLVIEDGVVIGAASGNDVFCADRVIMATGAWAELIPNNGQWGAFGPRPIRGQMIGFAAGDFSFSHVIYSPRGYIVPRADRHVIAGATMEDVGFRAEVTPNGIAAVRKAAEEIAPVLADATMNESWAGLRPFVSDGLPVIGEFPGHKNAFIATGHFRNGILLSPITGRILADLATTGKTEIDITAFSPERFSAAAAGQS